VKLRTFDNRLVRIPNETLLKSEIANLTHFAIRRVDLVFIVPYDADHDLVRATAAQIADDTLGVLDEPRPFCHFEDFALEGVKYQVSAWSVRAEFFETRNRLARELLLGLASKGVKFAPPVRVAAPSVPPEA
jgi:small conductance mechanosensitive channel